MKNKEKKNENQVELFKLIEKVIPANVSLTRQISKVLNISSDSSYRRIRGEKLINFEEIEKLCKQYDISLDVLLYGMNKMQYSFIPKDLRDIKSYLAYADELDSITEKIKMNDDNEIILSAADIPAFYIVAYDEVRLFHLFSWHKNFYDFDGSYEDFVKELDVDTLKQHCEKIYSNYQNIPSTEVWTQSTIDSTLKMINYHCIMDHFENKNIPIVICDQLLNFIKTLGDWIKKGSKGTNNTPFKFYVNEVDIGNTLIFNKNKSKNECVVVRLFTVNGINIRDLRFCNEVDNWLNSLIKRSSLISGISTKERFLFLSAQKKKITDMIDKIKTNQLSI